MDSPISQQHPLRRVVTWLVGEPAQGFSSSAAVTCAGFWAWIASPFALALSSLCTGEGLKELNWMIEKQGSYLFLFYGIIAAMAFLFCLCVVLPVIVLLKNVPTCWRLLPAWGIGWALSGGFWLALLLTTGGSFSREILCFVLATLLDSLPAAIAVSRYYRNTSAAR